MSGALQRAWLGRGPMVQALRPLAWLHGALGAARRALYLRGMLHTGRLPVPVVVVGNVVAGGAGKTPVVIALLRHLQAQGRRPGLVARGYGRRTKDCREVLATSDAADVGDEPLLVHRATGAPACVASRRVEAAQTLLAAHPEVDVIVSDDGLQHLALPRTIEICVFDGRGAGNGLLLPAGPLREPWPRPVDFVLHHGGPPGIAGHAIERRLAADTLAADGSRQPLARLRTQPVAALAGIARPQAFFSMLQAAGLAPEPCIALPDHASITAADLAPAAGRVLLCTEKDAVKLWPLRPDALAVPLEVTLPPPFLEAFDRLLAARL